MSNTTKKLYSVQYIKITKAISDFEDNMMEVTDGIYQLNQEERKNLIEDLEGTVQTMKFLINSLSSMKKDK